MPLLLTLLRAGGPAGQQRESRMLEDGALLIGRAPSGLPGGAPSDGWVLADPAQHLSKTHCSVQAARGGWLLTDLSSNGTFLNGSRQRMERDSQAALADGDEFALGDYVIQVRAAAPAAAPHPAHAPAGPDPFGLDDFLSPAPVQAPLPAAPPPRAAAAPPAFDPFADPERGRRDDPFGGFDDLPGAPRPMPMPFGEVAPRRSFAAPDPFDAAADAERRAQPPGQPGGHRQGGGAAPARAADPFGDDDDLFGGAKPAVQWQGPSQPDNVDANAEAFQAPRPLPPAPPAGGMDAWDDLLGDSPPGSPFPGVPQAQPLPIQPIPIQPAAAQPPPPQPPPPVPAPAPAPPTAAGPNAAADTARLVAAFLEGAGVAELDVSRHDAETWFRGAGEIFGLMVDSLRDVLMSRAAVKGEFGVEQTMLRSRNNNALKFSVTPQDAIGALLQPGKPGYMDPKQAAKEAFDDVRVHQVAVMAGVQAALMNLLHTFDPAALESRLGKGGMMESLVPSTRRAKLWEAFCTAYKDIAKDADSDFQAVFGREFARAYIEQAKMK